jgi:hypothetical protein
MQISLRAIRHRLSILFAAAIFVAAAVLAGCGSGSGGGSSSTTAAAAPSTSPTVASAAKSASCGSSVSSGSSEAASTAAGDIPDNQNFLTFQNRPAGYSVSYPEGWARSGSGNQVTFQDKSNTIAIQLTRGPAATPASVDKLLKQQAGTDPCLSRGSAQSVTVGPNQAVKVTYTTQGAKSPVTGQRPKITVDRYIYSKGGKVATVDLANPVGVDNVDAFRMISESFRWS